MALAHRVSWEFAYGHPGAMFVCHRCDNTLCVNPEHLFLGTHADNMRDARSKGRATLVGGSLPGEQSNVAKLTDAKVLEIRRRVRAGEKQVALAAEFGVSFQAIGKIHKRGSWRHLP